VLIECAPPRFDDEPDAGRIADIHHEDALDVLREPDTEMNRLRTEVSGTDVSIPTTKTSALSGCSERVWAGD
jgi:hypothetical protein